MSERIGKLRFWLTGLLMGLLSFGLLTRLYALHLIPDADGLRRVERIRSFERAIQGWRGSILESSALHNTLALNINLKDVCADPMTLQDHDRVEATARLMAEWFDLDVDALAERLSRPNRRFEYIRRFVSEDEAERLRQQRLTGVFFRDAAARHYPLDSFLCHVVGFTNLEGVGSAGIEQSYNAWLTGAPGVREGRLDGGRRELPDRRIREVAPRSGADVILTIDQTAQHLLERALDAAMQQHAAKAAWAIVQRVRTGEILAMASRPAYDLNDFRTVTESQRLNRAIGVVFEPGSVMKAVVIAAAINEGLITPETVLDCENGMWNYAGRPLRDYRPHGRLTVADIIQKSSNIGTAKIALEIGDALLERYLRDFGFGAPLGVDLPGEEAGILHPSQRWSKISASRISIGQGVATTALQMLNAVNAIANDGFLMRPYVVREVRWADDGRMAYRAEPVVLGRPISAPTAAVMRAMLRRVTQPGGTGRAAAIDGLGVAGKTGTAQKPVAGRYSDTDYMAAFVGFFPSESPEIGMIVVVDEPQPLHTGGAVAAPIFRQIAEPLARYLDVGEPPSRLAQTLREIP